MTERTLEGIGVISRAGVGTVVWHRPAVGDSLDQGDPGTGADPDADTDSGTDDDAPSADRDTDPEAERERFEDARADAERELERERERTAERVGEDEAAVFDAHVRFLNDPTIADAVEEAVEDGLTAERAVERAFADPIDRFEGAGGRTAERADDLRDVRDRLLRLLVGGGRPDLGDLPDGAVVLAERLTPSETARLDPERVAGFATAVGGRTSHAAIFARSMGLPAVVGVGDALFDVAAGATVLVEGDAGEVVVDPGEGRRAAAAGDDGTEIRDGRATTADGREIAVAANVGRPEELEAAVRRGADEIGLYRTEFLFLDREAPPGEDEQIEAYRAALEAFPGERVVVRTIDAGGDKSIPYLDRRGGDNPFLGERGIRRSLGPDADLFETQLRALLRAGGANNGTEETETADLAVVLPMVARVEEVEAALSALDRVAADLDDRGVPYTRPEFGAMVETPAATFLAPELAERVDFLSLGTNDLAQYVMAAGRGDERVADLRDPANPAVLRAIARTVEAADGEDCRVAVCGEMGGDPAFAELLVGLGIEELSTSPVAVPAVKARVEAIETAAARDLADAALSAATADEVRRSLSDDPGDR